ncbi:uncharacterized protein METZ01_LOCUS141944, partial [marine metagenome]
MPLSKIPVLIQAKKSSPVINFEAMMLYPWPRT